MFSQAIHPKVKLKLHDVLILTFLLIIALSVLSTSIPTFYLFRNQLLKQISAARTGLLVQISDNVLKIQGEIITISDLFYHNQSINDFTANDVIAERNYETYRIILESIDNNIRNTLSSYQFDYQMQLLCVNGLTYSTDSAGLENVSRYPRQLWFADVMNADDDLFWLSSLSISGVSPNDENYFSLIRKIKDFSGEVTALIIINIDERVLFETYSQQLDGENSIYLVDQQGRIVSHPTSSMIGRLFYDMDKFNEMFRNQDNTIIQKLGENYLFSRYTNTGFNWITIEEIPLRTIFQPLADISVIVIVIAAATAMLGIILSLFIAGKVSNPLTAVYGAMQSAQQGNFSIEFPKHGFAETRGIALACEGFVKRITGLLEDVKYKEQEKHKLELDFLQAQINPHFLYNTLFTIKCMVDMGFKEESCTMIDSLTGILKATLGSSEPLVTIESEMELLRQYGIILQKRYKGLFKLNFDIERATFNIKIIRFLLQPIIENAVFHGFASMKKGGEISVTSRLVNDQAVITIRDNGCGMPADFVRTVLHDDSSSDHIGLKNVYKRIKLHYEDSADMTLASEEGSGTTVTLTIPVQII